MLKAATVLVAALALAAGCGEQGSKVGEQSVYDRIAAMTSCTRLQAEFETAMTNVERYKPGDPRRDIPLAYAKAVVDRQKQIGC